MADTIREKVIQDIVTQLETLSGYTVFRGKSEITKQDIPNLPIITVLPQVETSERQYGVQSNVMPVNIHAVKITGDTNPSVVGEKILGELISGVVGNSSNISNIEDIKYTGGGIDTYPTEDEQAVSVQCSIEVDYETVIGDPYSQI